MSKFLVYVWICLFVCAMGTVAQNAPAPTEGDYVAVNFHFRSGELLPSLRLHYTTFGAPKRDESGRVTNAVMILHGTTGSGYDSKASGGSLPRAMKTAATITETAD